MIVFNCNSSSDIYYYFFIWNSFSFDKDCFWGDNDYGEILSLNEYSSTDTITNIILSITGNVSFLPMNDIKSNMLVDNRVIYNKEFTLTRKMFLKMGDIIF